MSPQVASILAATIAAIGGLLGAYMNKVHKENRKDHSFVAEKLGDLHDDVRSLKDDVTEVKIDVGVLKARHDDVKSQVDELRSTHNGKL